MIKLPSRKLLSERKLSDFYPHFALIVLSLILIIAALNVQNSFVQNILSNMAATSLYTLVALSTYDIIKGFSEREKNKELRKYAVAEVDPHIMSILISLSRLIYTDEDKSQENNKIKEMASFSKIELMSKLSKKTFLGFDVFRNSTETTKNIRSLLENTFIRPLLGDNLVLLLLKLSNRLESLYSNLSYSDNLTLLNENAKKTYKIFGSQEVSSYNAHYPNRKLLVKRIPGKNGIGVVEDFADFDSRIDINKLLYYYNINEIGTEKVSTVLLEILDLLKVWLIKRQ